MTQPSFVPVSEVDQVRPAYSLRVPNSWVATRPGELRSPARPGGPSRGNPGPDQGYALRLARRFEEKLRLSPGENVEDVLTGCALLGARRAALAGRAPCAPDLAAAFDLFGFLEEPVADLVKERTARFRGVAHGYQAQRRLVDGVPEELLRPRGP
jgi:hypothetical protein